ncbi:MAG TPA: tRNA 2-thiouridine(34) synthase MnmA [Pirellulales bacterium]
MSRVVLAMSGGVDSSVAAHLLRDAGYEVIGVFMRHGETHESSCDATVPAPAGATSGSAAAPVAAGALTQLPILSTRLGHKQGCCTASDAADARRVADLLDIPFYALDFQNDFGRIMDYFVDEYTAGRTPNPCVMCNNWLKFGTLADYADSVGADYIATGHYARIMRDAGTDEPMLVRGVDPTKDQSYVLFGLRRDLLARVLLPVGGFQKSEIRARARQIGLRVADKHDSQEICFVPDNDYAAFVRRRRGDVDLSGEIVTTAGEVVGRHTGIENYTIGQRKGLGLAFGTPRYVVRLDRDTQRVVIGTHDELACHHLTARDVNWLIDLPQESLRCQLKIRYLSQPVGATIEPAGADRFTALLDEPKHGVAPGQAAVCYDGDRVLGGGWIA